MMMIMMIITINIQTILVVSNKPTNNDTTTTTTTTTDNNNNMNDISNKTCILDNLRDRSLSTARFHFFVVIVKQIIIVVSFYCFH